MCFFVVFPGVLTGACNPMLCPIHVSSHANVRPWVDCMPQYNVGHAARRDTLGEHVATAWDNRYGTLLLNVWRGCVRWQ